MADLIPKLDSRRLVFQPLYVPLTSAIGFIFVVLLFTWNYPQPNDLIGHQFVGAPEFWPWVFELGVMFALLTVVFGPLWKQLVDLFREQVSNRNSKQKFAIVLMILLGAAIYILLMATIYWIIPSNPLGFGAIPQGHHFRIMIIYAYAFITLLPLMASILLIYEGVLVKAGQIDAVAHDQVRLFEIADDLLRFRTLLQNLLFIAGIIVSIVPVATATLRSIFITIGSATVENYPITIVMIYGLFFTMILILFYAPAHLQLADTSRKLRDALCPIHDLATLEDSVEKRKTLDDWLQTNIGLTQNLKAGIFALAPLVSGFVTTMLGIK